MIITGRRKNKEIKRMKMADSRIKANSTDKDKREINVNVRTNQRTLEEIRSKYGKTKRKIYSSRKRKLNIGSTKYGQPPLLIVCRNFY